MACNGACVALLRGACVALLQLLVAFQWGSMEVESAPLAMICYRCAMCAAAMHHPSIIYQTAPWCHIKPLTAGEGDFHDTHFGEPACGLVNIRVAVTAWRLEIYFVSNRSSLIGCESVTQRI